VHRRHSQIEPKSGNYERHCHPRREPGKLYHIGRAQQRHDTLRDALMDFLPRIIRIDTKNSRKIRGIRVDFVAKRVLVPAAIVSAHLDALEGESSVGDLDLGDDSEEVSKMDAQVKSSDFQRVIEDVETLPVDGQMFLIEIIRQRLIQHRRSELVAEVAEARQAYQMGNVRRGTVEDLLKELDT
jgi:hypothetical protein